MVLAAMKSKESNPVPTNLQPATVGDTQALLVDERTAAAMLGVAPRTLWSLADSGELPCVRIGRRKLYSRDTLRRFIAQRETAGAAERS